MERFKKISVNTWINLALVLGFTIIFLLKGNYEFLLYAFTIWVLIYFIEKTDKIFNYSKLAKYGFNLWLFLHFSGAAFTIAKTRLYDLILIPLIGEPFNILKYDQVIHAFCFFVFTLFIYSIVMHIADKKANRFLILFITVLAGASIGAINEIIEFSTVVFLNAAEAVGDYYNNALDLVFNFIGAIIAGALLRFLNSSKK
ncbi:MAG: DUF2238 domain-containing protein [Candidatus Nanoarchaeia archaeon]